MVTQYLKDFTSTAVNSVIYNYYNMGSKLHIYKRVNYRDRSDKVIPFSFFSKKLIEGDNFSVTLSSCFTKEINIDRDYFEKENGDKAYIIKDEVYHNLHLEFFVDDIYIKFGDQLHLIPTSQPYFKIVQQVSGPLELHRGELFSTKTLTLDVTPIRGISYSILCGKNVEVEEIPEVELLYYYECACDKIKEYLNSFKNIHDLEVK